MVYLEGKHRQTLSPHFGTENLPESTQGRPHSCKRYSEDLTMVSV